MYTSNVPLSLLENEGWKDFFQKLHPSFKLPSRYQLSNKLLDNEYKSVQEKVKEKIQSSEALTLLSDGWTDINGTALINILFTTPEPVFYTSIDTKLERHTGEYICSILSQAIDEIGQDKVRAVITDNAANMKLAWRLLKDKYPTLITYGCQTHACHGLNLLIRDIINLPLIKKVLGKCLKIIKFFTQKQLPRQWLKKVQLEKGGKEIALTKPVETRWGSHLASFESILKNREYLQTLAITQDFKDNIKPRLLNTILYDKRF
jgi:hypothetical protein